jgi:hypothetical protein
MSTPKLRLLSLGAGVQSTALYLMAATGEFGEERPTVAIFADTGWEPEPVYTHLDRLEAEYGHVIPIHRVSAGNIREDMTGARGQETRFATMPLYILRPDEGGTAMVRRQCTKEYKIEPIRKEVHRMVTAAGIKKTAGSVEQWIGISWDEAHRMKPADVKYITHRWPLVDARLRRSNLVRWLEERGWATAKSSCIGCPFHDDAFWLDMQKNRPDEFAEAAAFDRQIRQLPRLTHPTYLHRTLRPLDEVEFRHQDQMELDGFSEECEGMCGV